MSVQDNCLRYSVSVYWLSIITVARFNVKEMVGMYQKWSAAAGKAPASVAVMYCNSYGYSDRISQTIAKGITKTGMATEMVDLLSIDAQEVVEMMGRNKGVVIMAPPSDSSDAQNAISVVVSSFNAKKQKVQHEQ